MGELDPTGGDVLRSSQARFALVNQHHADQIDLTISPLEYMGRLFPQPEGISAYDHTQKLRSQLANCGVTVTSPEP